MADINTNNIEEPMKVSETKPEPNNTVRVNELGIPTNPIDDGIVVVE